MSNETSTSYPTCLGLIEVFAGAGSIPQIEWLYALSGWYQPYHQYVSSTCCVLGIIFNSLHIKILLTEKLRIQPINTLLTSLALCQMTYMSLYVVYQGWMYGINKMEYPNYPCDFVSFYSYGWMVFLKWFSWLNLWLHTTSLWLIIGMAMLRCFLIRRKRLESHRWLSVRLSFVYSAAAAGIFLALTVPTFLMNRIVRVDVDAEAWENCTSTVTNPTLFTISVNEGVDESQCIIFNLNLLLTGVVFKTLPCLALILLSLHLILSLTQIAHQRAALLSQSLNSCNNLNLLQPASKSLLRAAKCRSLGGSMVNLASSSSTITVNGQQRSQILQHNTTRIILLIVAIFVVGELPQGVSYLHTSGILITMGALWSGIFLQWYQPITDLLDVFSMINAMASFALYCSMNSFYRAEFERLVTSCVLYSAWLKLKDRMSHPKVACWRSLPDTQGPIVETPTIVLTRYNNSCLITHNSDPNMTHSRATTDSANTSPNSITPEQNTDSDDDQTETFL